LGWLALAFFGLWLSVATKTYWPVAMFGTIALLGGALELNPRRGSRANFFQAGIVATVLFAVTAIAAIAGVSIIADELQGVPHRPWRFYGRLVYDPARDAFGSAGGALFWIACFGACLIAATHQVRRLFGKGKDDAT